MSRRTSNIPLKPIPQFLSEEEECEFWLKADTADYFAQDPNRQFETSQQMPLTLKFDARLVMVIKRLASVEGIPYERLIQRWLWERTYHELLQRHQKEEETSCKSEH